MARRHELRSEQWETIRELLPPETGREGRPSIDNRQIVNAIRWILRTGAPWRDLPEHYPKWKTVHSRFSRWTRQGVWARVLEELAKDQDDESFLIDATIVRAHQDAAGALKKQDPKPSGVPEEDRPRRFTLVSTPSAIRFISTSPKDRSTT
jgi:transposase